MQKYFDPNGYKLTEKIYSGPFLTLFKATELQTGESLLLETLGTSRPIHSETAQILRKRFSSRLIVTLPGVFSPKNLLEIETGPVLVYDIPAGLPLAARKDRVIPIEATLDFAVSFSRLLSDLHNAGYVHQRLSTMRIWFDPDTLETAIAGLFLEGSGKGSDISSEPDCRDTMAPEQTGRTERPVDRRADLYSFGAILYQLLTGNPPFKADNLLEIIHSHIALPVPDPGALRPNIPGHLSELVMKLLAKNPDSRYQSAYGVGADLEQMSRQWKVTREITMPILGGHDSGTLLSWSEELVGREEETAIAQSWVGAASQAPLVLAGSSGVGKTQFFRKSVFPEIVKHGRFAGCKFDLALTNTPGSGFVQLASELCREFLSMPVDDCRFWTDRLQKAIGSHGRIITDLVPLAGRMLGEQPEVYQLEPTEAAVRYCRTWANFINACSSPEHPLFLFFDDMQWIDETSMELLTYLVIMDREERDHHCMHMIFAYRDDEIANDHNLLKLLEQLFERGFPPLFIGLKPLAVDSVRKILSETLKASSHDCDRIAELVTLRTAGNPFFVKHFVNSLKQNGLLRSSTGTWQWDISSIEGIECTANVVEFLAEQMRNLPALEQRILKVASCIGKEFETDVAAEIIGCSEAEVTRLMQSLQKSGYIIHVAGGRFRFVHDRVQQAAGLSCGGESDFSENLNVVRALSRRKASNSDVFIIAGHLAHHKLQPGNDAECRDWINTLLKAAMMSRTNGAAAATIDFSDAAIRYLEPLLLATASGNGSDLEELQGLSRKLLLLRGEGFYLTGRFGLAEADFTAIIAGSETFLQRAPAYRLHCCLHVTRGDMVKAVKTGFAAISEADPSFHESAFASDLSTWLNLVDSELAGREIGQLVNLPKMDDPEKEAIMDILSVMILPAQFNLQLQHLMHGLVARMIQMSLRHGNAGESPYAYIWWGMMLVDRRVGRYRKGYAFGRAGYDIVVSRHRSNLLTRACLFFGDIVNPYAQPLRTNREFLDTAFNTGLENGDLIHTCYVCNHRITNMLVAGDPLSNTLAESDNLLKFVRYARDQNIEAILISQRRFILAMQGMTSSPGSFNGPDFDEDKFERQISKSQMGLMIFWHYVWKMAAKYLVGKIDEAAEALKIADRLEHSDRWNMEITVYIFFRGMILAACAERETDRTQRQHLMAEISECLRHLKDWSDSCPANFAVRHAILSAEHHRLCDDFAQAGLLYESAIQEARRQCFPNFEGIACERAASLFEARGMTFAGDAYDRRATECWVEWGAHVKAAGTSSFSQPVKAFELLPVPDSSVRISSLEALLPMIAMIAGATRLILLRADDAGAIPVSSWTNPALKDLSNHDPEHSHPVNLVKHVLRSGKPVFEDRGVATAFPDESCWQHRTPESIACLPLEIEGRIIGVAYFENFFTPGAFVRERMVWPEILCLHALSLKENSRLLSELSVDRERLALAISAAKLGIWEWDVAANRLEVNDRWLQILGYEPNEVDVSYEWWAGNLHPDDKDGSIRQVFANLDNTRETFESTFRMKSKTGGWVNILSLGKVVKRGSADKPLLMTGVHLDMTEHFRLEERIRQAEKMEAVGQLAGGIAHDFNNQLGGILGYAELLEEKLRVAEDAALRRYAEGIRTTALRAADLTRQMLAFARKGKHLTVPVDLHAIIGETAAILKRSIDKRIAIRLRLEAAASVVTGDPAQLQNAVLNLGVNARDAMPQGGELVFATTVETLAEAISAEELTAGRYLVLSVTDSGIGMDEATRKRIFEPFFTTKEVGKGTGLGLASVYGAVKNHGGVIRVYSDPGHGSTFRIHLPLSAEGAEPAPTAAPSLMHGHGRILLVDDEAVICDTGRELLTDLGYTVTACDDPVEALALYRKEWQAIDLVILDMVMPKLGGKELFLALREINPRVRALLTSGHGLNGEAQSILDAGVLGFVQKPFRRATLARAVAEAIGRDG